ncbi:MAG: lysine exporter LysO family protein [Muribaculaceae bacterium]|nr:lysine exporter LysO family protein [Muribaculaceae bacterium]
MRGSLVIVSFFIAGIVLGLFGLVEDTHVRDISYAVLCVMLFCVGYGLGSKPYIMRRFKTLNPRLALLPLATILGTLIVCLALSMFMEYSVAGVLAVGSGFGYYSLSSIMISQSLGAELGTIALLSNIVRELITLLGAPLLVKMFGKLAPISAGGATTMDSTLPVIMRTLGEDFVLVSMFHGFLVDFSVPFLVAFFCSL